MDKFTTKLHNDFLLMYESAKWGSAGPVFRMNHLGQSLFQIPGVEYYPINIKNELVGGGVVSRTKNSLYLTSLFIRPEHSKNGLGSD